MCTKDIRWCSVEICWLLTQNCWLAEPRELTVRQIKVRWFFLWGWFRVKKLLRIVLFRVSLNISHLEWLTVSPFKYQCILGDGFPRVSQEQLSWLSVEVQCDENRICGGSIIERRERDELVTIMLNTFYRNYQKEALIIVINMKRNLFWTWDALNFTDFDIIFRLELNRLLTLKLWFIKCVCSPSVFTVIVSTASQILSYCSAGITPACQSDIAACWYQICYGLGFHTHSFELWTLNSYILLTLSVWLVVTLSHLYVFSSLSYSFYLY